MDTDGDGVADLVDIDDDNDGVPDLTECPLPLSPNSCSDPSFGFVQTIGSTGCLTVEVASPDLMTVDGGYVPGNTPLSPDGGAFFSAVYQAGTWDEHSSITIYDLVPGDNYRLEFWQAAVGQSNGSAWYKNGYWQIVDKPTNNILGQTNVSIGPGPSLNGSTTVWTFEGVSFTAVSSTMTLKIKPRSEPVNDPIGVRMALDGLRVVGLSGPPCDTDSDGIPNSLDTDSDNDGCSDAFESGATTNLTPAYTFSGPYGSNGLSNSVETSAESGTVNYYSTYSAASSSSITSCTDTDSDGVADTDDIDDDNDGVVDAAEAPSCFSLLPTGIQ
jgi:hypothetical protein